MQEKGIMIKLSSSTMAIVTVVFFISVVVVKVSVGAVAKENCSEEAFLHKVEPCLAFLQNSGSEPQKECCDRIEGMRMQNPVCLCMLVKDSTNPSLQFSINQTRLIQMSDTCKINGKISDCIAVLHLTPNSPDARIFEAGYSGSVSELAHSTASAAASSNQGRTFMKKLWVVAAWVLLVIFR